MKKELDEALCKKYPKIFRDRHAPMTHTAMCWGFECGDGWYNIINQICRQMQHHIDYSRKQRARDLRYNRALARALKGDILPLEMHFTFKKGATEPDQWAIKNAAECVARGEKAFQEPTEACPQVVASQVKEKFGTLRFYYYGGDDYCRGLECMGESMSALTCETCGNVGKLRSQGWFRTLCDTHALEQGYDINTEVEIEEADDED